MDTIGEGMMTLTDAAAATGIKADTLKKRLAAGLMRGQSLGGRVWLVPREEVERVRAEGLLKRGRKKKDPDSSV